LNLVNKKDYILNRFFSREQLYIQVWKIQLIKLAPKYNITALELKKTCDKLNIPVPSRYYWSNSYYSKKQEPDILPRFNNFVFNNKPISYIVSHTNFRDDSYKNMKINMKKTLSNPHKFIQQTIDELKKVDMDKYCMKRPRKYGIDIRVSKTQEKRALRIMDAVITCFEKNGYIVKSDASRTTIIIDNEHINIAIEEKSKFDKIIVKEVYKNYTYSERTYKPTQKLTLQIKSHIYDNIKVNWSDSKRNQLENILNSFIEGVFQCVEFNKLRNYERVQNDQKYEYKRKKKAYIEKCKEFELESIRKLELDAINFNKSIEILDYIKNVKLKAIKQYGENNIPKDILKWIAWANKYANNINPINGNMFPSYKQAFEVIDINTL